MADSQTDFAGSIPEIYDQRLGPMLFEPYARDLARRFFGFDGELLELAAGTGRVTLALAEAAPNAAITATDLSEPMLAKAAGRVHAGNVRFQPADAHALPFPDQRFDAIACQFGVMFFADKERAFAEAHRVLRPHGRLLFSVWDALERNEISRVVVEALAALFPQNVPTFYARTPFGWHDREAIAATLAKASFREMEIDVVALPTTSPSAADAAEGLCLGTPMRAEIEERGGDALQAAPQAATEALQARFGQGGPITGASQALVVAAKA
jgi:ubiquinone/menaquinone biosynthesis C-methylase UbiE